MLNVFREHARSVGIKIAFGLIIIVFVFWGGYAYKSSDENQVAKVGERYISIAEYENSYRDLVELYRRQLGDAFSSEMVEQFNLKQQAFDRLVDQIIIMKSAEEMGLSATTEEIQQKVLEFPVFVREGKFDQELYVSLLRQNRLTPEAFERQMAEQVTLEKIEDFIKRRAVVTEEELRADFDFTYGQIQLAYSQFDPKTFEPQVTMEENALQSFHQTHQERYMEPEKRKFSFVIFKTDDYKGEAQLSEDDIRSYYEDHPEKYHKEAEVKARHILFSVKEDASEEEVNKAQEEARKVLSEAKGGADFAELAKKHSQDPGSSKNGGDLGYFPRDRMVEAFSEAAFALKPSEISDLVRTPFGFHIIKVEEVRPEKTTPFEEAKAEIESSLKADKARDVANNNAIDFADMAYARKDVQKAAQEKNLKPLLPENWMARTDSLPGLSAPAPEIMTKLFGLEENGISDIIETPQGFLVAQVVSIQQPKPIPFETAKDRVEKDYRVDQAKVLAQQKASELLDAAKTANSLDEAAKGKNIEVKKTGWFSRRQPDKDLRFTGEALNKVFQLQEAKPFPESPMDVANRIAVVQLLGRQTPSADFEKEREAISKRILAQKERLIWQAWLEEQRGKAEVKKLKDI